MKRLPPIKLPKNSKVVIAALLILVITILAITALFVGDFGDGYKVTVSGYVEEGGITSDDFEIKQVVIGDPVPDHKILSFSPAFSAPWEAEIIVRLEIENHDNDLFQFAHPYEDSVGTMKMLQNDRKHFSIEARHLLPGEYDATLQVVEPSFLSEDKIHATYDLIIEVDGE